jgi:hypothetical protein
VSQPLKAAGDPLADWIVEGLQRDSRSDPADQQGCAILLERLSQQRDSTIARPGRQRGRLLLCSVRVRAELENYSGAVLAPTRQDITEVSLPE